MKLSQIKNKRSQRSCSKVSLQKIYICFYCTISDPDRFCVLSFILRSAKGEKNATAKAQQKMENEYKKAKKKPKKKRLP